MLHIFWGYLQQANSMGCGAGAAGRDMLIELLLQTEATTGMGKLVTWRASFIRQLKMPDSRPHGSS